MPTIRYTETEAVLLAAFAAINNADKAVGNALTNFAQQVDALAAFVDAGSAHSIGMANIIETAKLAENADDLDWQSAKSRAEKVQADAADRLAKYQAALPTVRALRDA